MPLSASPTLACPIVAGLFQLYSRVAEKFGLSARLRTSIFCGQRRSNAKGAARCAAASPSRKEGHEKERKTTLARGRKTGPITGPITGLVTGLVTGLSGASLRTKPLMRLEN